jgi:hypothetical protein
MPVAQAPESEEKTFGQSRLVFATSGDFWLEAA